MSLYFVSQQHAWLFLLALVLCLVLRKHPRLCYYVWIAFLLKLLIPFEPIEVEMEWLSPAKISSLPVISFLLAKIQRMGGEFHRICEFGNHPLDTFVSFFVNSGSTTVLTIKDFFALEWILLSVTIGFIQAFYYLRFTRQVRQWPSVEQGRLYDIFLDCCHKVEFSYTPILRLSPFPNASPFTIGMKRRTVTVVVPEAYADEKSDAFLQTVFGHELSHIKNGDAYINFLQLVGLVLFHIHPLRIVADRFINFYKEVCCDVHAIRCLGIRKKEYTAIIAEYYLHAHALQYEMASAMVGTRQSFVKRLLYIRTTPLVSLHTGWNMYKAIPAMLLFLLLAGFSVQAPQPIVENTVVDFSKEHLAYPLPQPLQEQKNPFPAESILACKSYRNFCWVVDLYQGILSYDLFSPEGFRQTGQYAVRSPSSQQNNESIFDITHYKDYVIVFSINSDALGKDHIKILRIQPDGSFATVKTIPYPNARIVYAGVYEDTLWASLGTGFGGTSDNADDTDDFRLVRYDLSHPENPREIASETTRRPPYFMIREPGGMIVTGVENDIWFLENEKSVTPSDAIPTGSYLMKAFVVNDEYLLFLGNLNLPQMSKCKLLLAKRQADGYYRIVSTAIIDSPKGAYNFTVGMNVLLYKKHILVNTQEEGTAILNIQDDRLLLQFLSREKRNGCFLDGNRLVFLEPNVRTYDADAFFNISNDTYAWNESR